MREAPSAQHTLCAAAAALLWAGPSPTRLSPSLLPWAMRASVALQQAVPCLSLVVRVLCVVHALCLSGSARCCRV